MNLTTFDLNLLVTFDALITERNVTRAGQKIGLSQPAMSAALGRLRYVLKDELFIRCGKSMQPTPRALQIADAVRSILNQIETSITPQTFDPSITTRTFRIAMNDLGAALFTPPITHHVGTAAPNISFEVLHADEVRAVELLEEGTADVAMVLYRGHSSRRQSTLLYHSPFVCAVRRTHPQAKRRLTLEEFANLPRVAIAQRGDPGEHIENILAQHGLTQRITMVVPHYLAVPFIVAQTDLVAVLPLKLVQRLEASARICTIEAPFPEVNAPIHLVWNSAVTNDPANRWIRSMILDVVRDYQLDKWTNIPSLHHDTEQALGS